MSIHHQGHPPKKTRHRVHERKDTGRGVKHLDHLALVARSTATPKEKRDAAIRSLEKAADSPKAKPNIKQHAIELLGNVGNSSSVPTIDKVLHAKEPKLRWVAARALGQIGGQEAKEALKIAEKKHDPEHQVAIQVHLALEAIKKREGP